MKTVSLYRDDFKTEPPFENAFDYVLQCLGIPKEDRDSIDFVEIKVDSFHVEC